MVKHGLFPNQDGGSIPAFPLHIQARELTISFCKVSDIREFIEQNHYSKNINGVKISYCFKVLWNNLLVGAILFGSMSTTAWKKFSDSEKKVLELRRLVLLDAVGKNAESRVIGFCLREIHKIDKSVEMIVSYADPKYGHDGTIYKASNFKYVGMSGKDKGYLDTETGKTYHSRALRTKYKGDFKPFVKVLKSKLQQGILIPVELPAKYCFIFRWPKK